MATAERTETGLDAYRDLRASYLRADRQVAAGLRRDAGLSPVQALALMTLRNAGGTMRSGSLVLALALTKPSSTSLVDILEARGLATRHYRTDDRRVVEIALTPTGETVERVARDAMVRACQGVGR